MKEKTKKLKGKCDECGRVKYGERYGKDKEYFYCDYCADNVKRGKDDKTIHKY